MQCQDRLTAQVPIRPSWSERRLARLAQRVARYSGPPARRTRQVMLTVPSRLFLARVWDPLLPGSAMEPPPTDVPAQAGFDLPLAQAESLRCHAGSDLQHWRSGQG